MAGRTAIGLDIGTSAVRAAELSFGKGQVSLERLGQVEVPPGSVRDGEVLDPDAVGAAIKQLWSISKFSHKKVALGVGNQKVVVRQVDLPWMPASDLRRSLPFQSQDLIPMPVDTVELDFHPLEEVTGSNGQRMIRGLLVAAARDMVLAAASSATKAGLTPIAVDLTSFALLRSVGRADPLGVTTDAETLVDIGARVTNIIVQQGGAPRFVRILLMGGQDITDAVAERLGVPVEQAEALKQRFGADAASLHNGDGQAIAHVVDKSLQAFIDEVRGSLDYFRASTGSPTMSRLVLTGGGSLLPGIDRALAAAIRLPVVTGHPIAPLRRGKRGLTDEQLADLEPLAAVSIGLALRALS